MAARAALLAAALLLAVPAALACIGTKFTLSDTGTKPAAPLDVDAYDTESVRQHIESQIPIAPLRSNTASTFSCVDGRAEGGVLGTPGGDIAELAGGVLAYLRLTNTSTAGAAADVAVKGIFKFFMDQIASPERPFYFHTSDEKLIKMFHSLHDAGVNPKPVVFPEMMPTINTELWMEKLTNASYQGCGHMRLMVGNYTAYGLDSPAIPQGLIREFFNYWWPTDPSSVERTKITMPVLQGPLTGHAVNIIDSAGACPGMSPPIIPSKGGSQIFVYHAKAVDDFRKDILAPLLSAYAATQGKTVTGPKFYEEIIQIQNKMLGAVLALLDPANKVGIFTTTVTVSDAASPRNAGMTRSNTNTGMRNSNTNANTLKTTSSNAPANKNAPNAPKNAPNAPKNAPNAPKNAPANAPKNAPANAPKNAPANAPKNAHKNAPANAPKP
ncbi:MAG: hypothetical protein J3K34DRAFT_462441 [Monoraphidium minutum]|nr:MAG: hypothetical protein J3K34DRAFT_462441 [Monoraphidium minutum]